MRKMVEVDCCAVCESPLMPGEDRVELCRGCFSSWLHSQGYAAARIVEENAKKAWISLTREAQLAQKAVVRS